VTAKPPTIVELVWNEKLQFSVQTARSRFVLDSAGVAGPSPVDALAAALAGCMAMDVAHILTRGRHAFSGMRATLTAERAAENPHRILSVTFHLVLEGMSDSPVTRAAIERAIALSHDTYCSVWHSLRQDLPFQVTFDVAA
jgi:putative redox protein